MPVSGRASIYGAMMRRSSETIVLADHTKFERASLSVYGAWSERLLLVTDRQPDGDLLPAIQQSGSRCIIA